MENWESLYKFKFNNAGIAPLEIGKGMVHMIFEGAAKGNFRCY
jgi:hypothetical protein